MRRLRRIPVALRVLLVVVLVEAMAWAVAVPALQGADEAGHFSYVQQVADAGEIPWPVDGALPARDDPRSVSTEQRVAWLWAGLEPLRGNQAARPLWTEPDEAIWRAAAASLTAADRRDAAGSAAWRNPPLYYVAAAVPYEIVGGSLFDRLFALRLVNGLLLLATVALTWLLAGEVFGRRRALQTVAAAAVALHPVLLDVTTRVTPDALLVALASATLYAMALVVRRGLSWRRVALLAAAVTAATLTQGRALALVAPALIAVGVAWWHRRPERRPGQTAAGALLVGAAALVGTALFATSFRLGDLAGFWSYLWQFYLPALPGMDAPVGPAWGVEDVYLDRFLATFVQFEVRFPADLVAALRVAVLAGLALLVVALVRHWRRLGERRWLVGVLAATFGLSLLALHAAAFRDLLLVPDDPVLTGRYLLMLIPLFGLAVAGATTALPGRARVAGSAALLAAGVLLQLSAFGVVVARFYA